MYILGINKALNASVVLMKDQQVIFAVQEERLSKVKNQPGFPALAVRAALDYANLKPAELDHVCVAEKSTKVALDRQDDLNKFHERYGQIKKEWFGETENFIAKFAQRGLHKLKTFQHKSRDKASVSKSIQTLLRENGLPEKAEFIDHHTCHAASAYYGLAPDKDAKYLIFSMDGGGDGRTSAVFIGEKGKLTEIAASDSFSPACLYAHITYIMGFLPHEHEYKLMGLAPYAQPKYAEVVRDRLAQFIGFAPENPLIFTNTAKYSEVRNSRGRQKQQLINDLFKETLNFRFDTLSAGLQLLAEEVAVQWIKAGIARTGIRKILLTGGFFMNVKANRLIAELPEVEFVNCFPSCGDETNAFGAAFATYEKYRRPGSKDIEFGDFCLGPEASFDLKPTMEKYRDKVNFEKIPQINEEVVRLLLERKIIARCSGRMEFGARALGNRSILASPDDLRIINKINAAIKKRDFWMPFAPAALQDKADLIIEVPTSLQSGFSPYMMFTFKAKEAMFDKIIAGIHQADKTARAQLVSRDLYPDFYDIINRFYDQTGIPAVLNTSFNLHGYPIVLGAEDAVEVFLNSALDILIIDDYKVTRK